MERQANTDDTRYSSRKVIAFMISLIIAIAVSYVYLVGMLALTVLGPETNIKLTAVKRGVLIAFHTDFNFRMVRNFFQHNFPFCRNIGMVVAVLSWAMGFLLLSFFTHK